MDATYALVVLLSWNGHRGDTVPMGDFNTLTECETAAQAAKENWADRHGPGYRVKLGAECILTITPNS
jgi:hypothetical protein